MRRYFWLLSPVALLVAACATSSDDGSRLVRVDHYVRVKSTAPAFAGQEAKIYVREVVLAGTALRGSAPVGVVLFVHGAGTPAEVTFDVPYNDYSWMAYLAKAGFDVFSMDMTGYGRSTRPPAMNDPCNFSKAQQAQFVPSLIPAPCGPSHPSPITTMDSDWNDIAAVVDHFKANWDRQVGCAEQYEPAASAAVWTEMLASDPVGATWGLGVRRAPQVPTWGFNQAVVAKMQTPFLMVTGAHDKQVAPERVRDLYADLGSKEKVIIDLACSSHNAMWERNRLLLFKASLEWLKDGKVNGTSEGELKLGY